MLKAIYRNLNFDCRRPVVFLIGILVGSLLIGCSSTKRYSKINFAWTSDHHLPPTQRFLSLNAPPEAVVEGIKKWVTDHKGEIIESNDNCDTIAKLQPDGEKNFLAAREIAEKEWAAYDLNQIRKWEEGEWQKLVQLSKIQVEIIKAQDKQPICLKTQLGKRQKQVSYREKVGTTTYYQQTYIYTKYGMIPGAQIPITTPKYATKTKTVSIASQIDFFIFPEQESTRIYAVGSPFDVGTSVKAAYGATIGYSFWSMVTGKDEASLISEVYTHLKNSYP